MVADLSKDSEDIWQKGGYKLGVIMYLIGAFLLNQCKTFQLKRFDHASFHFLTRRHFFLNFFLNVFEFFVLSEILELVYTSTILN